MWTAPGNEEKHMFTGYLQGKGELVKRKLIYIISFLLILAAITGPAIYAHKISSHNQAAERSASSARGETVSSTAGGQTSPVDSVVKNGEQKAATGTSAQSNGLQADNGLAVKDATARKSNPSGTAGQDSTMPVQKPTGTPPAGVQEDGCVVGIAVVGMSGELLYGPGNVTVTKKNRWDVTALGALDATALPCTISTRWNGFVEAGAGQLNKGQSGWMYKVNSEIPMVAADQKPVKTGDKVIWWYSKKMGNPSPDWDELVKRK